MTLLLTTLTAALLCLAPITGADTNVSGEITTTTWTAANAPYHVTDTVNVPASNTLTIEPGVDVLFDADVPFIVEGALHAVGTEADSIRFIAGDSTEWGGIRISGGDSSTIFYARISDAYRDAPPPLPFLAGEGGGIYVSNSSLGLAHAVIRDNAVSGDGGGLFADNATVTLDSCTIVRNTANKAGPVGGDGGGVYAVESTIAFTGCVVTQDSAAGGGGGVHGRYSTLSFAASDVVGNSAVGAGGGIRLLGGDVRATDCSVSHNTARTSGGGVYLSGVTADLSDCAIAGNTAGRGGGLYATSATVTLIGCAVEGNRAGSIPQPTGGNGWGGGICTERGSLTLRDCSVSDNVCGQWGGGFMTYPATVVDIADSEIRNNLSWGAAAADFVGNSILTMSNCLIAGNTSYLESAGLDLHAAHAKLVNCTVVDNVSLRPEQCPSLGFITADSEDGVVELINTIIWGHGWYDYWRQPPYRICGCYTCEYPQGAPTYASYCDVGSVYYVDGWWSSAGNISADPMFVDTIGYALQPGSQCIDTGSPYVLDEDGSPSDMGHTGGGGPNPDIARISVDSSTVKDNGRIVVYNTGWADLEILACSVPDSFTTELAFPQTISPNDSLYIVLRCAAKASDVDSVVITHSDEHQPPIVVEIISPVAIATAARPSAFALSPNVPNPFNPATRIPYALASDGDVRLVLYNTLGQRVRTLVDGYRSVGEHSVLWDGRDDAGRAVASGVYVVRMVAGEFVTARRVTLLR